MYSTFASGGEVHMSDSGELTASTNGHDVSQWLGVSVHAMNTVTTEVMSLTLAVAQSWVNIVCSAQESQARFSQSAFQATLPVKAVATYGIWCLAAARSALQENQKMLDAGLRILEGQTKPGIVASNSASEAQPATQAFGGGGNASLLDGANFAGKSPSSIHESA
jgi:hypothetical protein